MTNINDFDPSLLDINKVSYLNDGLTMYDIKYIKNSNRLNTLYLVFNNSEAVFQKSGKNKYLIFSLTNKNKIRLENCRKLFDEITEQIELVSDDKVKYHKDIMKIKFETKDDLSFCEIMLIPVCLIIVSSIMKKKIMNTIHKFCYMIAFMSMRMIIF